MKIHPFRQKPYQFADVLTYTLNSATIIFMLEAGVAARDAIDRRSFLRSAVGAVVGAGLGLAVVPHFAEAVNNGVADATDHPTGNASWEQMVKDSCAEEQYPEQCVADYQPTFEDKVNAQVIAPVMEEVLFRGIPSFVLECVSDDSRLDDDPFVTVLGGTEPFKFSRKEMVVGAISSVLFGAVHNLTSKGFDTKTIPASQTADGFLYWCLMRRFGIASSMAAHAGFNYRALRSGK